MSRYDIEKFEPPPDPDLVCCICQCVLDKAVESPCRHVFCQACIERWLTNRHTCPTCRKRTKKQDLKPVLPLVQNMLNRLIMKCDYRDNGCMEKIVLEQFDKHVLNCDYEMKTCRFSKCGIRILKKLLSDHERNTCEHRESVCEGECGLMIPLSDKCSHNCVAALKAHIEEKNRMIETLKTKLQELNNLSQSLNDQLEQLRQQLDDRPRFPSLSSMSGSDSDLTDLMSSTLEESLFDETSNHTNDQNQNDNAEADTPNNAENTNTASDVVEQVERTIVTTLFDVSSRLEVVRNQMRAVLDAGFSNDNENLHFATPALDAIINNNATVGTSANINSGRGGTGYARNNLNDGDAFDPIYNFNNLSARVMDSNEHSSEARDGDVMPENHSRLLEDHSNINSDFNDRDLSFSYRSELSNHSHTDLSDLNDSFEYNSHDNGQSDGHDINGDQDDNSRHHNSSHYSSHNQSFSDHYSRDERILPNHIILSDPPDSPSNSNSSFSSLSSSIPTFSSISNSPAHTLPSSPVTASTPRADHGSWRDQHDPSYDEVSNPCEAYDQHTPPGEQPDPDTSRASFNDSTPHSSPDIDNMEENDYQTNVSDASNMSSRSSHSTEKSFSEHSKYHGHSPGRSSLSSLQFSPRNFNDISSFDDSDDGAKGDNMNQEDKWNKYRLDNSNTTDEPKDFSVSAPSEPMYKPSSESDNLQTQIQGHSQENITWNDKNNPVSNTGHDSHHVSSSTSADEQKPSMNSIPSDSTEESDQSESIKYLTKRVKHKKEKETPNDTRTNKQNNKPCGDERKTKSSNADKKEMNSEKSKHDSIPKERSSRKRRGGTEPMYQSSQCKKMNSGTSNYGSYSQPSSRATHTISSIEQSQGTRRSRSGMIQTAASDNTSQSLNVKIDLSLINYSSQVAPQTVSSSAPSATLTANLSSVNNKSGTKHENSGMTERNSVSQNHKTASPRTNDGQKQSRCLRRRENRARSQTRGTSPARAVNVHNYNTRSFPHSWCDDSDNSESSDDTYVPGSDRNETDVTITDEEYETDTSYEVQVPKSAAELLEEYGSDESDTEWIGY